MIDERSMEILGIRTARVTGEWWPRASYEVSTRKRRYSPIAEHTTRLNYGEEYKSRVMLSLIQYEGQYGADEYSHACQLG